MSTPSDDDRTEESTSGRSATDAAGDAAGREAEDREAAAVDAATAERRSDGVRVDAHGEYEPDPYPDEQDPGDTTEDVIDRHRRQAERVEHHPDVPRADE